NSSCELRFSENLPVVALASPPGAGNTWVRHLLQQATGIYTGSVFHDGQLFNKGFRGERDNPTSGRTVVVKIHEGSNQVNTTFNAAILLMRNVLDCCISEINSRKSRSHTGVAHARSVKSRDIARQISRLHNVVTFWLTRYNGSLLIVHYEDVMKDTIGEVTRMLDFLNISEKERRMHCVKKDMEGQFHRQAKNNITMNGLDNKTIEILKIESSYISELISKQKQRYDSFTT
ncbi:sialate:O-sulfotransferase 1-like, partial [Saccoglossus kowalevskii]|uniref:WSC domain-containing protein 1-like n=1 Tax=Saccoglossus kowalevskii TaxID=10224 RepID=A0ABM0M311_SACKO